MRTENRSPTPTLTQAPPARPAPPGAPPQPRGLTLRSIVIGLLCVALLCGIIPYNDYHLQNTFLYGNHFPLGAIFLYTLLILGLNVLLYRVAPRHRLGTSELLTIWAMMLIGAGLA